MFNRIVSKLALFVCKILFRLEAVGTNNVPKTGGFILASNHASYLDPIVIAAVCPRQLSFMARHDLFEIPVFGPFIRALGSIPLRRDFADVSSLRKAIKCLRQGYGLLLFPEGSRSVDEGLKNVKPGVGFIAGKSRVPVVPAYIQGSQKAFPRHSRFIRPVKIKIYFGNPIYSDVMDNKDLKEEAGRIKNIYEGFTKIVIQEIKKLNPVK